MVTAICRAIGALSSWNQRATKTGAIGINPYKMSARGSRAARPLRINEYDSSTTAAAASEMTSQIVPGTEPTCSSASVNAEYATKSPNEMNTTLVTLKTNT